MLIIKDLSLYLKQDLRLIIKDFNFTLKPGDKVALIGEEGNGKSSLLKAIYQPDLLTSYIKISGQISTVGEIIGYLPQELPAACRDLPVCNYFRQSCSVDELDYTHYYHLLDMLDLKIDALTSLAIVRTLSGGEKIKLQLLCQLLKKPTLLLLDEPSNDLDLSSLRWLENFLTAISIPVIFVSHDETLIAACANTIIHFEQHMRKKEFHYSVSRLEYSEYKDTRTEQLQRQTQQAKKEKDIFDKKRERFQQIFQRVEHEQNVISRAAPSAAANLKKKMHSLKSMERRLEKEQQNLSKRPDFETAILLHFNPNISLPAGKPVLNLELPELRIGNRVLSQNIRLNITGPAKIGIIGQNGCGKTTLLRRIVQELSAANIPLGYMPQDYSETMPPEKTALDFLISSGSKEEYSKNATYLGSLNFTYEEMNHPIRQLSGGQKAKLFFAKMILAEAVVLILDEPTRNLSPLSMPEVRNALKDFGGAIISVSHDRSYLAEVCQQIYRLDEKGLHLVT